MLIQAILLSIILIIVVLLVRQWQRRQIPIHWMVFWLAIWVGAATIIWQPEITSYIANRVGVRRGADLAIYSSVVLLFYIIFRLLLRIERLERLMTTLVSEIALQTEKKPDETP